ncbi:MAG: peptidylprolyl isomerase [Phaeodactylibacter sp.]|nr:peptidylprolyl isomerase [Phaeodactylibacter sp.]MCB9299483.1 peptidylprolyl isomerase [Lewinellaceae bacterium]HQU58282.1 peptidylprolyl isomerase [Saprospiraceae bacterium]
MAKRFFHFLLVLAILPVASWAQQDDPVLFTVEKTPVQKSEFVYIYSKTNGKDADFSRKSLEEYLDLYIKFKLKVQKAREMKLDTIPQLKNELAGYRRQLADSYLLDKEVTEKLIQEAYDHIQQDVDISHILIAVKEDASPADTLASYQKAMEIKKQLAGGGDFAELAKEVSADKSAANNGGHIGFVTALFPNGFYELEKAAYSLPLNKLAGPIRTSAGYHLLIVHGRRPARGEMEAAHILLRTQDKDPAMVKKRIDSIYLALQSGADFETLAKQLSEDGNTASNGGYIGFFGINKFSRSFEDAAFALQTDGAYSQPFQTNVGWHIVKRISHRGIQPYNIERSRLEGQIKRDLRFEEARQAMIERIKKEANLKEYPKVLDDYAATLTDTFLTFRWKAPEKPSDAVLFELGGDYKATLGELTDYMERSSRQRIRMGREADIKAAVQELYAAFLDENIMKYEEKQLEKKYPDFKSLMREYEEGILLFEATKMLVWDKAAQDSSGLAEFFKLIEGKYRWEERAVTSIYRMQDKFRDQLEEVRGFVATHTPEEVLAKYNTEEVPMLRHESKNLERSIYPEFRSMEWKVGALSQTEPDPRGRSLKFIKIEEILQPRNKTLDEARGYAVADYQDYLETKWVEALRKEYTVKVNQKVFDSLVR